MTETTLTAREYEQFRAATETYREELIVRLCGEVGLRAEEAVKLRPQDIADSDTPGAFLAVDRDSNERTAYAPAAVVAALQKYIHSNEIAPSSPIIDVSARRVQMLVDEIGSRAAAQTGRPAFESVTPSVLRRSFGQRLLIESGVDARVVAAVGGWKRLGTLLDDREAPSRATIAAALEDTDTDATDDDRNSVVRSAVASVDDAIVDADCQSEIDDAVCDGLATVYPDVWLVSTATTPIEVRAHTGETPDRFDGAGSTQIVRQAVQTGRTMVAPDEPGAASGMTGRGTLAAAPVSGDDVVDAALVVRSEAPGAFDDPERAALTGLARRIALAEAALRRKQLLLGNTVLAVEFEYGSDSPVGSLSAMTDCRLELDGVVDGGDGTVVTYHRVRDADPATLLEAADTIDGLERVRLVQRTADGGVIELVLATSPLVALVEYGGVITDCTAEAGTVRLTAEVPQGTDLRALHDRLAATVSSVALVRKRERQSSGSAPSPSGILEAELTDRQRSVLEGAYRAGYFEWPRESTAEDLAASMGVSPPTLHNHLRKAQNALLSPLFEDGDGG